MSFSFNNPLIIGNPNKKIQNEIGDLSQLETTDKSSLVNALNEALDSTLNGADRNLSNLSTAGESRLHALKGYADKGELLTDAEGLQDVKDYAHSTFDRSKFTVVGSPNITDEGIASGFSSSDYIKVPNFDKSSYFDIKGDFTLSDNDTQQCIFSVSKNNNYHAIYFRINDKKLLLGINWDGSSWGFATTGTTTILENTRYFYKIKRDETGYKLLLSTDGKNYSIEVTNAYTTQPFSDATNVRLGIYYEQQPLLNGSIDLKQLSITVDGVPVFSGNKTGIDTIKPDDYTIVGSPTISNDGIASGFSSSSSNYLQKNYNFSNTEQYVIKLKEIYKSSSDIQAIFSFSDGLRLDQLDNGRVWFHNDNMSISLGLANQGMSATDGDIIEIECGLSATSIYLKAWVNGTLYENSISGSFTFSSSYIRIGVNYVVTRPVLGSIDLNAFKIYVDGDLVYQSCLKIPYTKSKTGSKVVNAIYRDRVNDMAEQFGYAPYYTLSDSDFTLPQGELYGLIGQRTLRDSYRNGINYWELYSNRDLEQGGSCTSGVEVTFARPFADTNYVLSVPYSAKSATAFTPTQTGDWIAKGKGLL